MDENVDKGTDGFRMEIDNLGVGGGRMMRLELPGGARRVSVGAAVAGYKCCFHVLGTIEK